MKRFFKNLSLRQQFEKIIFLQYIQMAIIGLCIVSKYNLISTQSLSQTLIKLLIFFVFYNLYNKTLKMLYYSYWTFSFFALLNILNCLFEYYFFTNGENLFFLHLIALIIFCTQCYLLLSPVFYPQVRWWEYDFRYRGDLKVAIKHKNQVYPGRLTDLRRGAGCVIAFDHINIGEKVSFEIISLAKKLNLEAEIFSKREYTPGRGLHYGVKFRFPSFDDKKRFDQFSKYWKLYRGAKIRAKFQQLEVREDNVNL